MNFQLRKQELFKPIKRSLPILVVAITPDGNYALSAGLDFGLRKWDLYSGECTHTWKAGGPLNAITIHPSGEWALISTVMGALQWDLHRWEFMRSFMTHKGGTEDIAFSAQLEMVIGAGEDSLVYRWDLETGERYEPLTDHRFPVTALATADDDILLISGDNSGDIRIWELSSGDCLGAWQGHDRQISDLAILPQAQRLVSASQEPPVKVWDLDSGEQLQVMSARNDWVHALAVNKQEEWMLSAGEAGLQIWDLENDQCMHSDHADDITCLALSANEKLAICGSRDGSLSTWSIQLSDQEIGEP